MDKQQVMSMLIELQKTKIQLAEVLKGYDELRAKLIPAELQQELAELETERTTSTEDLVTRIETLENSIRDGTLAVGETVKVDGVLMAVWNKGRVTWDTKGLDGLMIAIPELEKFRKQGLPSVAIRGA